MSGYVHYGRQCLLWVVVSVLTLVVVPTIASTEQVPVWPVVPAGTRVVIDTNLGKLTFQLHSQQAPQTTAQFVGLAKAGYYNGKSFYRVVAGHVIQAGLNDDNHPDMQKYRLPAEFSADLPQLRGSLGLARGEDPNSGSVEFYICLARRAHLDNQYTNFGQLVDGEQVLSRIGAVAVTQRFLDNPGGKPIAFHQPIEPVLIRNISVITPQP